MDKAVDNPTGDVDNGAVGEEKRTVEVEKGDWVCGWGVEKWRD